VRNLEIGRIRGCLGDRPIQEQCRRWVAAQRPQKTTRWTGLATCIPQTINEHTASGQYLAQRSDLIANLAQHIQHHAGYDGTQPVWAPPGTHLDVGLIESCRIRL
jgi:hypothetical protein